jgi:signal peptidase I
MKTVEVIVSGYSMWPNLVDGQKLNCIEYTGHELSVGDLVVFKNPFDKNMNLIKRITKINSSNDFWIEGDNPDPTSSNDSHNFGYISKQDIIAFYRSRRA